MKRTKTFLSILTVLVGLLSYSRCNCELMGRIHNGYFNKTRWGYNVFHSGVYHIFVSDEVASRYSKYYGKPLEIKSSKISQTITCGAGLIQEIEEISEKGFAKGLILSIKVDSKTVEHGAGINLHLSIENISNDEVTIWPGTLAIAFVTDSPFSNKDINYKDPDDCSYWYYNYTYRPFKDHQKPMTIACHRIMLPWTAKDLVEKGKGIRTADKERGFNGPITIQSKGKFKEDYVTGKELLPDDYEVFFYVETNNFSNATGPISARIPFDVIQKPGNEKISEKKSDSEEGK